jgi:hypothetical protein
MAIKYNILLKMKLSEHMDGEYSREKACQVWNFLLDYLEPDFPVNLSLHISLKDAVFTPGVADEIIGGLAMHLGAKRFKEIVKIVDATDAQKALMKHVIARRVVELTNDCKETT